MESEEGGGGDTDWILESQLGSGGFGIVNVWRNRITNQKVALKRCKFGSEELMSGRHRAHWAQEVDIMLRLDHENVVKCFPVPPGLDQGSQDLPSLCMEYCESGDLRRVLNLAQNCRGLPEAQILPLLRDVASALAYLHNKRIIHRDLKPENVVLKSTDSRIVYKLIDLGYAKELGASSLAKSFVGTLQYVAPELFLEKDYTKSVDYWSLGLICHEIVTGQRPFLPHFSPGQWVDHVQSKDPSHIAVVEGIEGDIQYKHSIGAESRVSRPLANRLEAWLRHLLEWNPVTRGKDDKGQIVVFSQLDSILRLRSVKVMNMRSRAISHFTQETSKLDHHNFTQWISSDLGIPEGDQLLLTSHGYRISAEDQLQQFVHAEHPIFVFDLRRLQLTVNDQLKQIQLNIPQLVQYFLRDARMKLVDYHHKLMYIHGFHFISEEYEKHRLFTIGLRALTSYVKNEAAKLSSSPVLSSHFIAVKAKLDFHNLSLDQDLKRYEEQSSGKDRITSNKMIHNWKQSKSQLVKALDSIHARVSILEESSRTFSGAIKIVNEESLQQQQQQLDRSLQECETRALQLYDSLRRERAAVRVDNTPRAMAQLTVRMLKFRDELLNSSCAQLVNMRQLLLDLQDLRAGELAVVKACEKLEASILRSQNRRQSEIWTLVSVAIKYIPQNSQKEETSSGNREVNDLDKESSVEINLDTTQQQALIQENLDLRHGLDEKLKSLETAITNQL